MTRDCLWIDLIGFDSGGCGDWEIYINGFDDVFLAVNDVVFGDVECVPGAVIHEPIVVDLLGGWEESVPVPV